MSRKVSRSSVAILTGFSKISLIRIPVLRGSVQHTENIYEHLDL